VAIILKRLAAIGPEKEAAEIMFHPTRMLIRGPSDTGKSYIRDCLSYLLGGDKGPKPMPEDDGYTTLVLEFVSGDKTYRIERALKGGGSAVFEQRSDDLTHEEHKLDVDEGELLVRLSGAADRKILRSTSEKGSVTGGDLRHWFLLAQPRMISEEPTAGLSFDTTQRVAAFNLFLTGSDDAAVEVRKSSKEVERIKGQLTSAEEALRRARAGLPSELTRKDVEDAFTKVDDTLSAMTAQYQARAAQLKELRAQMVAQTDRLNKAEAGRDHSQSMVQRFNLLDKKYASDLERLGATSEGVALFDALPETACPLCGTPAEKQLDPKELKAGAVTKYRTAIAAEAGKIAALRKGLQLSLDREIERFTESQGRATKLSNDLERLEAIEKRQLTGARVEFAADPKTMAVRHSELSAQLASFDEIQRLENEITRLKKAKVRRRFEITRDGGSAGVAVAAFAKELLNSWGFADVTSVTLDALECDLVINGRTRLSYGAGKRAIFLAGLTAALLQHATQAGNPHLGFVVIDSPLKAYADPTRTVDPDVSVATVTQRFYSWLAAWNGRGQIVILENEKIDPATAAVLQPLQFTGLNIEGRSGFYPKSIPRPSEAVVGESVEGTGESNAS
jgi:hypothetical protein